MSISKKYLDHFYVRNITSRPISLGDLSLLSIGPNKRVDLLTVPLITKEKINQSYDLQEAVRQGRLVIEKEKCRKKKKTKSERQATLSDEEIDLCDLADVNISGLSDDDLLQYNINTGKWENIQLEDLEGPDVNIIVVTGDYDVTCDDDVILVDANLTPITISMPPLSDCLGKKIAVKKIDESNNLVTIDGSGSETIDSETEQFLTVFGDAPQMVSQTTGWYII